MDNFFDLVKPNPCTIHGTVNCNDCEQEAIRFEYEYFLQKCGSCLYFIPFHAEAGFCKIAESNCICKNSKAMIDMWNNKCYKWIENTNL